MPIFAAHQHGAVAFAAMANMRGEISDGIADASRSRIVATGAVNDSHMMDRHLAGLENAGDRVRFVDVDGDLLVGEQHVGAALIGRLVGFRRCRMGSGNDAHRAVFDSAWLKRYPDDADIVRLHVPIIGVLMPGDEFGPARLLDEEARAPAEDIRDRECPRPHPARRGS